MNQEHPDVSPKTHPQVPRQEGVSRRAFMMGVGIALNAAIGAAIAVPVVAYLLGPILGRKDRYQAWVDLGEVSAFPAGETTLVNFRNPFTTAWDGETANLPAYVRSFPPGQFTVFAVNCAHLGCPVRWFAESQLFMCPCHGGAYYADGSRASGPPERGLFTYETKIENNRLFIHAGQMPTLSNRASATPCPSLHQTATQPALVTRIEPCPGTNKLTIG